MAAGGASTPAGPLVWRAGAALTVRRAWVHALRWLAAGGRPGSHRGLTPGEVALARGVFGDSIRYENVRIWRCKAYFFQPAHVTMAPDGHLYFHPDAPHYRDDFAAAELTARAHFIHEMTHVLQHQSGINVRRAALDRRYGYRLKPGKCFASYGLEQQGEIATHYYLLCCGQRIRGAQPLERYEALRPFRPRQPAAHPTP
jgi:hypothetical protein